MYFIVKALIRSLILPPTGLLIVAIVGFLLRPRHPRFGAILLGAALASLWLLSTPIVADAVSRMAERYPPLDLSKPTDAQAIVILGGGGQRRYAPEFRGPEADFELLERLSYGAHVARATRLPVLVSGTREETVTMRESLWRDFGVPTRWVEDQSHDTYENARFSARILSGAGIGRIILVTSSTHEYRAAQEFRGAGLEVVPAPAGVSSPRETGPLRVVPGPAALVRSHLAVYELIGEQVRRLQAALGVRERFNPKAAGEAVD